MGGLLHFAAYEAAAMGVIALAALATHLVAVRIGRPCHAHR